MSDEARNHHYVPACYLKHFATPQDRYEGRLNVYDRATGRMWECSPHKSARERDFYRVEVAGQHPNLAENTYEILENRFAPTIAEVNERGTLPKDPIVMREVLAFVASQAARTPRVRALQQRYYGDLHQLALRTLTDNESAFTRALQEWDSDITNEEAQELFHTRHEFLSGIDDRGRVAQTTLVGDALELATEIEGLLAQRHWMLGRPTDDATFITTDDPVHLRWAGRPSIPPMWSPGFGDRDTEVVVALGTRLVLIGLPHAFDRARMRLSRREVAKINTGLALSAHRFVYSVGPSFVHVAPDGTLVDGPTEALLRSGDSSPVDSVFGWPTLRSQFDVLP